MPTECSPGLFEFAPVAGRAVVASFDGGAITSDAGALLLGATDRAIGLVGRFAACFRDARAPERVEHEVDTLVGQRVFGIALGHEDLIDHDQLRHDPVLAVLAGWNATPPTAKAAAPESSDAALARPPGGAAPVADYARRGPRPRSFLGQPRIVRLATIVENRRGPPRAVRGQQGQQIRQAHPETVALH
jgi:hypothetical protein